MLDNKILRTDYGVSYGSVTLKSLQNDNIPELELLVREAIQNSSDASLKQPEDFFAVNFTTGKFAPNSFNSFLSDVEDYFNERFPEQQADFLEIRDTKTSGLTGCIRKSEIMREDHGNFFKLIYDTGKRQTQENAGGNWGFGKSVYYRVGIGIVIFYSQIKTDSGYESRLIITLVEDEGKKNADGNDATILNRFEPLSAGKAWWGIQDGSDLLPISDPEFINPLLEVFGLLPFKEHETGTSIIIPYIDKKYLLDNIIPVESEIRSDIKEHFISTWASTVEDYLRLTIQKWYAPKIHNRELKNYEKKWLLVSVNNNPIKKQDLLPFFNMVQELYTTAFAKTNNTDYISKWLPEIETYPVNIQKYIEESMTIGFVAVIKIGTEKLNADQNLLSPYDYVGKFEADGGLNEPIVMFARDPGMVIDYPITGPWVKNISPLDSPEDFLFAFFVPDTKKHLRSDLQVAEFAGMTLGEYLRSCEASDHKEWNDPSKMKVVDRIQKNTINQVNKKANKTDISKIEATASKLSNKLGKKLLPRIGYGKKPGAGGGSGGSGGSGGTKLKDLEFMMLSQTVNGNDLEIPFKLKFMHARKTADITVIIASEGGWIDAASWQSDIGTRFPAEIFECSITSVQSSLDEQDTELSVVCSRSAPAFSNEILDILLGKADKSNEYSALRVQVYKLNVTITGILKIHASDKKYRSTFKVE